MRVFYGNCSKPRAHIFNHRYDAQSRLSVGWGCKHSKPVPASTSSSWGPRVRMPWEHSLSNHHMLLFKFCLKCFFLLTSPSLFMFCTYTWSLSILLHVVFFWRNILIIPIILQRNIPESQIFRFCFVFLFSLSVVDISYFLQTKNLIWMKIYTVPQMGIVLGSKHLCVDGPDGAGTDERNAGFSIFFL